MAVWQFLSILFTGINLLLAVAIVFLERRNVGMTWAWLMVLLFLPGVGFLLYLLLGQNLSRRKLYKIKEEDKKKLDTIINKQRMLFKREALAYDDPMLQDYHDLIYMNLMSGYALYSQNNQVEIFTDGVSKFDALFRDIEAAKEHIHLEYYIVQNDNLGRRVIEALTRKAEEGVQVRFLYDDIGSTLPRHFFRELIRAGGKVAAFFPSRIPYLNIRVNYRNHRKIAVIDGAVAYIGGFNIGDEYLGRNPRFGEWRDTHLRIRGDAALQLQAHFLMDWNLAYPLKIPDSATGYFPAAPLPRRGKVGMQIVSSGPDNTMEQIKHAYIKMIHEAKSTIYIQTPYFIPDESVLTALKVAVLSGVDVRIMIPAKPDHKMVYWASYSYLGDLLEVGMKCYLYEKGFLHAKTVVIDGKVGSVGTANMDNRSFKLNFETTALLYDTETVSRLERIFEDDAEYCRVLTYEEYRNRPTLHKIRESCTRLLSPIL
ncbi:major cardiolipin synthase ClsA [Paenibacillus sp. J31TS4]|uniref:cardiolipin synthase n=1 Tax=Paenibacillus sp. J31TS4 TaxID=2807195 RepID=UPI001B0B1BF3|nr:cardiolipin synthase [Paenibacillus sp. J31TS4]GIP37771.1 major cardiolipin synthase ClsA [Paenibacillus sp. J31TS4]